MADGTKKAVVLSDAIRWPEGDVVLDAHKGDEVELPADEFARLEKLGAVAHPKKGPKREASEGDRKEAEAAAAIEAAGGSPDLVASSEPATS